jgi:hypothetical protein
MDTVAIYHGTLVPLRKNKKNMTVFKKNKLTFWLRKQLELPRK